MSVRHQRAEGRAGLVLKRRGAATVLDRLGQAGCLKLRFPRVEQPGALEAVLLNSSGGVAGGDRLHVSVLAGPGTRGIVSSQAAERHYRALPGMATEVTTRLEVGPGAAIEWLPQETILFDGSALRRRLVVELAADAGFVGLESLVLGRLAMGETVRHAALDDLIELRRDGRLLLHDRIRLEGDVQAALGGRATGAGAAAVATLIRAGAGVEALADPLRAALAPFEAGVSAWDGLLLARILAADGACLRRAAVAGLDVLREGRTLPRVWMC